MKHQYPKLRVHRSGFHRSGYIRSDGVRIDPAYVPPSDFEIRDLGHKGRGPKTLPKIRREGALTSLGYHTHESEESRHAALRTAVRRYGKKSVEGMLAEQVGLRKNSQHEARKVFAKDREWVSNQLLQ